MWKYPEYVEDYRALLAGRRDSRYLDYPYQVSFETLALCNATCGFCPYPDLPRKGTRMSDSLIAKIVAECRSIPGDLPLKIVPLRVNEPFLDKRIFDICAHIGDTLPNAAVSLFSNASPLNPPNLLKLAAMKNLELLVVSLHDHRPDAYERIMGLPLARTLRNLEGLHELKAAGAIAFPVEVSRVGDGSSYDEEFCRWGKERFPLFTVYSTARADWMGAVNTPVSPFPPVGCGQWFNINILADGKAAFCCVDSEGRFGSGNAAEEHILEIYNRPARRRLREELRNRSEIAECAGCPLLA
jgi:hypothetical protein